MAYDIRNQDVIDLAMVYGRGGGIFNSLDLGKLTEAVLVRRSKIEQVRNYGV
jgi:hypothetical protein